MKHSAGLALILAVLVGCTVAHPPAETPTAVVLVEATESPRPTPNPTPTPPRLDLPGAVAVPAGVLHLMQPCSLSPGGETLACLRYSVEEGLFDLFIIDPLTWEVRQIAGGGRNRTLFWSPDGQALGMYTRRSGREGIWIAEPVGEELMFLSEGLEAAWSPDGERIAVVRHADSEAWSSTFALHILDPRTGEGEEVFRGRLELETGLSLPHVGLH